MTQSIFDKIVIKWIFNKSCQNWTLIYVSHCTRENRSKRSRGSELFNARGYPPGMLQSHTSNLLYTLFINRFIQVHSTDFISKKPVIHIIHLKETGSFKVLHLQLVHSTNFMSKKPVIHIIHLKEQVHSTGSFKVLHLQPVHSTDFISKKQVHKYSSQ
ncbi:hypothetical protein CsSME_00027802 [Camellia sinensis var. sinensis]